MLIRRVIFAKANAPYIRIDVWSVVVFACRCRACAGSRALVLFQNALCTVGKRYYRTCQNTGVLDDESACTGEQRESVLAAS